MKVLSLFDGMSCGQIALKQLGITPQAYYASEIDKPAIRQTQLNFPDTVQLGDVVFLRKAMCWRADVVDKFDRSPWISEKTKKRFHLLRSIRWDEIDLVLAGSPCQGFSFAGKQLAFDDPRSRLFFEFINVLNHIRSLNPDVMFLLENVNMKRSYMRIISDFCGVFPVNINSNLVSAQNRDRWYWTNIRTRRQGLFGEVHSDIPQPKDRGIFLRDVLEEKVDEKYYITSESMLKFIKDDWRLKKKYTQINGEKALPALSRQYQNWCGDYVKTSTDGRVKRNQNKASCLTGAGGHGAGNHSDMDLICVAMRGREDGLQHIEPQNTGKTNCLTSVLKDNLILQRPRGHNQGGLFEGKTPTLSSCAWEQNNLLCERQRKNLKSEDEKASAFLSTSHKGSQANGMTLVKEIVQINPDNERIGGISINDRGIRPHRGDEKKTGISELGTIIYDDQKTDTCTTSHVQKFIETNRVCRQLNPSKDSNGIQPYQQYHIRRLTPTECARLQTVPAWYRWDCSDTQIYRMLGNGWTIEAIMHILSYLKERTNKKTA